MDAAIGLEERLTGFDGDRIVAGHLEVQLSIQHVADHRSRVLVRWGSGRSRFERQVKHVNQRVGGYPANLLEHGDNDWHIGHCGPYRVGTGACWRHDPATIRVVTAILFHRLMTPMAS